MGIFPDINCKTILLLITLHYWLSLIIIIILYLLFSSNDVSARTVVVKLARYTTSVLPTGRSNIIPRARVTSGSTKAVKLKLIWWQLKLAKRLRYYFSSGFSFGCIYNLARATILFKAALIIEKLRFKNKDENIHK